MVYFTKSSGRANSEITNIEIFKFFVIKMYKTLQITGSKIEMKATRIQGRLVQILK